MSTGIQERWDGLRDVLRGWGRRGRVTPVLVGLLCLLLVGAAWERGRGNIHKLSNVVNPDDPREASRTVSPGPGGQAPVQLSRTATAVGGGPEFVSATLLPGRGMNVYQITAIVPGHGEVKLLVSPTIQNAESVLTGTGDDADGSTSTSLGGAFLLPWAGSSRPLDGLLLNRAATEIRTEQLVDGQATEAVFEPATSAGKPASAVQVVVRSELTAHTLELTVTAKNTADQAVPFGIGWRPHFAIPSGDRENAVLRLPTASVVDIDARTKLPTGRFVSGHEPGVDFRAEQGSHLRAEDIHTTYTDLKARDGEVQPIVELRDPAYNLGLRLVPESASIRFVRVMAPTEQRWVTIEPNTTADDPLGPEWDGPQHSGIVLLAPGASLQWKVRLEVFALSAGETGASD